MIASLVIFDCDGVLVDSEPLAARVLQDALLPLGLAYSLHQLDERFRGRSLRDCVILIESELGAKVPEKFLETLTQNTEHAFRNHLTAVAGVLELVLQLEAAGIPLCVASSGTHEKIRLSLALTKLLSHFESHIFSALDVPRGKPAPDLFEYAARQMGASIHDSIVIEDSLPGVQAGSAAGAQVLAYVSRASRPPAWQVEQMDALGARRFEHMCEVPDLLGIAQGASPFSVLT